MSFSYFNKIQYFNFFLKCGFFKRFEPQEIKNDSTVTDEETTSNDVIDVSKECTKSPNDFSLAKSGENANLLLSNDFWFKSLPPPPSSSSLSDKDKEKALFLDSLNNDVYDNASSFNNSNKQTLYTPINFTKSHAHTKYDNSGAKKKCSFYQEPNNDTSTFTNSATLLINTNSNKILENPSTVTNTIYSQVYPSSSLSIPKMNNEKTILIETDTHYHTNKSNFNKNNSNTNQSDNSRCKTNTLPTNSMNDTFTSKLPPVPRRNSKNALMQNSNTNLNSLSSSHNINKTYNELAYQQQQQHQDSSHHLNSLLSLNKNKLYQKM
jgi:hypothetical protein